MKTFYTTLLIVLAIACTTGKKADADTKSKDMDHHTHASAQEHQPKSKSPKQTVMGNIGQNHVHIEYHSPSKRGRQIFGGLVAYGEVWVTGAHNATSISFSNDVEIGGVKIPNGKYALFTIPNEKEWVVIINKNWDQHLADEYDEKEDVVRVIVYPEKLDEPVESLKYTITAESDREGKVSISWDNVMISFKIKNAVS